MPEINKFKVNNLEVRINPKESAHPEFEIVCWSQDRNFCWTIATFHSDDEWFKMETVGDRIWSEEVDPKDFMEISKTFIFFLQNFYA